MRARVDGQVLREFRRQRGWSQERLAQEAGLSGQNVVHLIETGQRAGSLHSAAALARALGISFHLLIVQPRRKEASSTPGP